MYTLENTECSPYFVVENSKIGHLGILYEISLNLKFDIEQYILKRLIFYQERSVQSNFNFFLFLIVSLSYLNYF